MLYNKKRNIIIIAIAFLSGIIAGGKLLAPKVSPQLLNKDEIYLVSNVIDGDTFKILNDQRIRLMAINSPEKGECYYNEAKQALQSLIKNKKVKLEKDITDKDRYGRWLRYAVLQVDGKDNILVNDYMVSNGYAFATSIPPDKHYRELLISAQEDAKRNKLGLWGECNIKEKDSSSKREIDNGPTDPNCTIKGNISEKGFGRTYLIEGCDNYNRVKIDIRKGEQYFCSEEEAVKAGFRKATNCP